MSIQAIKQKLQINRNKPLSSIGERASPQEEDKAKILFGNRHAVSTNTTAPESRLRRISRWGSTHSLKF